MDYILKEKLKSFIYNLTDEERCVYEKYLIERSNQIQVGRICFNPPVSNARVAQVVKVIKAKYLILVNEFDKETVLKEFGLKEKKPKKGEKNILILVPKPKNKKKKD